MPDNRLSASELLAAFAALGPHDHCQVGVMTGEGSPGGAPAPTRWLVSYSGFPSLGGDRFLTAAEAVSLAGDMAVAVNAEGQTEVDAADFDAVRFFIGICATAACQAIVCQYEAYRRPAGDMDPATPANPAACQDLNDLARADAERLEAAGGDLKRAERLQ